MSIADLVTALEEHVRLAARGDRLDIEGSAEPPAGLLEELRRTGKAAVIAYLNERGPAPVRVVDRRKSDGESSDSAPRATNELSLEEAEEAFREYPHHFGRPVASVQDLATGLMRPLGSTAAHAVPAVGFDMQAAMAPWGNERMAYYVDLCQRMLRQR